jgi:hypothetical protein
VAESFVEVTQGSGTKLHSYQRTIGANAVEDEVVVLGEQYLAGYVSSPSSVAVSTSNSHLLALMAGSSLKLYIRRITVTQFGMASAAGTLAVQIFRLTTAGSGGGTTGTPRKLDTADAAAGATALTLNSSKGTEEANPTIRGQLTLRAAEPVLDSDGFRWEQHPNQKALIVPAGTANGIAIKNTTNDANATVVCRIEFDEANF